MDDFEPVDSVKNRSFDVREEDELRRLLTPSDFLKNLLGSLHDQPARLPVHP
jgi:hypothetical protein